MSGVCRVCVNNFSVYTLEATILTQSLSNLLRMIVLINLGHVGSKSRSVGQILVHCCLHSRGNIFRPIFMKLCQIVCSDKISFKYESGSCGKVGQ